MKRIHPEQGKPRCNLMCWLRTGGVEIAGNRPMTTK
jgi:hypothetical protein